MDRVLVLSLCKESWYILFVDRVLVLSLCKESWYILFVQLVLYAIFKLLIFVVSVQFSAHSVIGLFNCLWY